MAPQVLEGNPYGIRCDVWSLGVVFYQALCGFMPWETGDTYKTLKENLMKGCSFPAALKINPTLEKLIFGMLRV
jgi:serine/threonine protein kinase